MNRLNKYNQFITENAIDRVTSCTDGILYFLKNNDINDWNEFLNISQFKKDVINRMIDEEVRDMKELGEVRYKTIS